MQNAKLKINERKLVEKILRGEKRVFERFYRQNRKELARYVINRVREREDAEEIVQDIFLSFLDSLPIFYFRSSLKTFLYCIARHEVADYYRRCYAKRALKLVPIVKEVMAEKLYSSGELSRQIDRVYRKLMPGQARILQWKYEEGWSVKQIARKLSLSAKAVESRLFRARKTFQLLYWEIMSNE